MSRQEFPTAVKAAAKARANGHCEACTAPLFTGKYHYDHDNPDGLTGRPTLDDCREAGAGYAIADTPETAVAALLRWGALTKDPLANRRAA